MSSELINPPPPDTVWGVNSRATPCARIRNSLTWTVLFASFAIFVVLAITVPLSIRYALEVATVKQAAVLQPDAGDSAALHARRRRADRHHRPAR
jgi:hypothetical protein